MELGSSSSHIPHRDIWIFVFSRVSKEAAAPGELWGAGGTVPHCPWQDGPVQAFCDGF